MTITEQITSQIDAVVQSISSYSGAVQAENQRTNKVKSDAAARCASQKSQIQQPYLCCCYNCQAKTVF